MFNYIGISIWCIFNISTLLAQDPVANLPQGRIVGIKAYTERSATPVEIYYGVPYATPPIGRYRFSAPERHTGWRRTFFAHRIPPHCPHIGDTDNNNYSEDCLFLNIWTPRRSDGKTLPVVVLLYSESWIRGGVYLPCQELAAEGVVVVTVMYRLHLLAFFTLRSISARGNLALLDQYLALLWLRDNISAFGGDPTAITLLGHSAGADSVLHHIISPRSLGLFQRAIIMSPIDIWKAINERSGIEAAEVERISREIARSLGCNSDTDHEILHCMRERPLSDILSLYSNETWSRMMQPVSDIFLPESEQFLPNSLPIALSADSQPNIQLDVLIGASDLEALNYHGHVNSFILLHCMGPSQNETWSRMMQPVSDIFLPESEQFLPNSLPIALSADSQPNIQLDVLIGASDLEALNYHDDKYKEIIKQGKLSAFEYADSKVMPEILQLFSLDRPDMIPMLARAIRWEYWNDITRNVKEVEAYIEFLGRVESSAKWSSGIALLATRLARMVTRLYVYRYSQPAGVDLEGRKYNFTGAVHGSDLVSLFGDALMLQVARRPATQDEKRMSLLLRRHIINFIQFGSPGEEGVWQRYRTGESKIYDIRDVGNAYAEYRSADRDVQFWIQYLPQLYNLMNSAQKTEQLTDEKGETRLRGGVFAMCGIAIVLLLLLFVSAILLNRKQLRQFTVADENHH